MGHTRCLIVFCLCLQLLLAGSWCRAEVYDSSNAPVERCGPGAILVEDRPVFSEWSPSFEIADFWHARRPRMIELDPGSPGTAAKISADATARFIESAVRNKTCSSCYKQRSGFPRRHSPACRSSLRSTGRPSPIRGKIGSPNFILLAVSFPDFAPDATLERENDFMPDGSFDPVDFSENMTLGFKRFDIFRFVYGSAVAIESFFQGSESRCDDTLVLV